MRNFIFSLVLLGINTFPLFGQEAGKAGELLSNEASINKTTNNQRKIESSKEFNHRNNIPHTYQWNYNEGNSEVFIRIPERGRYSIEVGDQMINNSNGKYRFFDLRSGMIPISIYQNDFLIYRTRVNVAYNSRVVLDFFSDYGLYLLGTYPLNNNPYGVNEWDDIWNRPYGGNWGNPHNGYYSNVMNPTEFNSFLKAIKNESFDDGKKDLIFVSSYDVNFTAKQIKEILDTFSFDDNKLDIAKKLYHRCLDRHNFYIVSDAFTFSSNKKKLNEYILKNR